MASYPNRYIKGDPDSTATGTALINIKSIRKYSAVTLHSGGWRYAGPNEVVHGSLYGVSSGHLQICAQGQDIKFRQSGNAVGANDLPLGSKILGDQRTVGTATNQYGYIKAYAGDTTVNSAELTRLSKSRGVIVSKGTANTAGAEASADVLVVLSYGLIV